VSEPELPSCHLRMSLVAAVLDLVDQCGSFGLMRQHLDHAERMWLRYQQYTAGAAYGVARAPAPTAGPSPEPGQTEP
jgi:hypothetical protein